MGFIQFQLLSRAKLLTLVLRVAVGVTRSVNTKSFTIGETHSFTKSKAIELYSLAKAQELEEKVN